MDVLADLGLTDTGRVPGFPGVWVAPDSDAPRKICAVGVKLSRGRSMHGFALERRPRHGDVRPHRPVRHRRQGRDVAARRRASTSSMREVVDRVAARAAERWGSAGHDRADVVWRHTPGRPVPVQPRRGPRRARRLPRLSRSRCRSSPPDRRHDGPPASSARRGRGHRGPRHQQPQAGVDAGAAAAHRRRHRHPQDDARPRPRHRVRGGRLPEPLRVLGRRHRHVHDQRRALHPGVRLLPRRHPPPAAHRSRWSRSGWPRRSSGWACGSPSSPRWPATTCPTAARPSSSR